MKTLFVLFLVVSSFSFSTFGKAEAPRRAAAEACVLCDDLIKYLIEIKEITETDEIQKQAKQDIIVHKAVKSLEERLKNKAKLSAKEIDMIFKFEAEAEEADNLHQLLDLILPRYKADKKSFTDRIERSPYKAKIKAWIKEFERLEKQGNG